MASPRPPGLVRSLHDTVDEFARAAERGDWQTVGDLDLHFHSLVIDAAASPRLSRLFGIVISETRLCLNLQADIEPTRQNLMREHRELADLIAEGDVDDGARHPHTALRRSDRDAAEATAYHAGLTVRISSRAKEPGYMRQHPLSTPGTKASVPGHPWAAGGVLQLPHRFSSQFGHPRRGRTQPGHPARRDCRAGRGVGIRQDPDGAQRPGAAPSGARITAGRLALGDQDLATLRPRHLDRIRGNRIAMLFQQPKAMLDPAATVRSQVAEPLRLHRGLSRRQAKARVVELLHAVGIPEPERRASAYAHQLSGGMAQRVMFAAALAGEPELLIADEPTTALDATVQAQILQLIRRKQRESGMSVLLITHDLGVVASMADRVAVMYAGRMVEDGTVHDVFRTPDTPTPRRCYGHRFSTPSRANSSPSRATRPSPAHSITAADSSPAAPSHKHSASPANARIQSHPCTPAATVATVTTAAAGQQQTPLAP